MEQETETNDGNAFSQPEAASSDSHLLAVYQNLSR
jgi:hypothetical protein